MVENPFTIVFDALWTLAESNANLMYLVKPGNRIKFNEDLTDPVKWTAASSDLPELILQPETSAVEIHNTSCGCKAVRRYTWIINTGDLRVNDWLSQVEWHLFVAMCNFRAVLLELEWQPVAGGDPVKFCKRVDVVSVNAGLSDQTRNRSIKGWSAGWVCDVEMHFPRSQVLTELALYPEYSQSGS